LSSMSLPSHETLRTAQSQGCPSTTKGWVPLPIGGPHRLICNTHCRATRRTVDGMAQRGSLPIWGPHCLVYYTRCSTVSTTLPLDQRVVRRSHCRTATPSCATHTPRGATAPHQPQRMDQPHCCHTATLPTYGSATLPHCQTANVWISHTANVWISHTARLPHCQRMDQPHCCQTANVWISWYSA
jgi:hypothetical protein